MAVTVTEEGNFGTADNPIDLRGLTVRQLLRALRIVNWGDSGTMAPLSLSDGSDISVELQKDSSGATVPSSQIATRQTDSRCIRYALTEGTE